MAPEDLRAASEAARRFTVTAGEARFECVVPARLEERFAANAAWSGERFDSLAYQRAIVCATLRGWSGVRACHIAETAGPDPVPFSEAARDLALAERTDWFDAIAQETARRMDERRTRYEAAEKNSSGGSPGS